MAHYKAFKQSGSSILRYPPQIDTGYVPKVAYQVKILGDASLSPPMDCTQVYTLKEHY